MRLLGSLDGVRGGKRKEKKKDKSDGRKRVSGDLRSAAKQESRAVNEGDQ